MDTPIALATSRLPPSGNTSVTAIIKLDQERAAEILSLMQDITAKARHSSRTFKISSFEPNALYVPSHALLKEPAPDDFLVLEPNFTVTDVTPVKMIHADVTPFHVCWEAYDVNETFKLTTSSLHLRLIEAIAKGYLLPPDTNQAVFYQLAKHPKEILTLTKHWLSIN